LAYTFFAPFPLCIDKKTAYHSLDIHDFDLTSLTNLDDIPVFVPSQHAVRAAAATTPTLALTKTIVPKTFHTPSPSPQHIDVTSGAIQTIAKTENTVPTTTVKSPLSQKPKIQKVITKLPSPKPQTSIPTKHSPLKKQKQPPPKLLNLPNMPQKV